MLLLTFAFLLPLEITAFLTGLSSPSTRTSSNQNYKSSDPTRVTSSLITPGPNIHEQALLGRDIFGRGTKFNTCGYVSGNAASPLTCPTGFDCTVTQVYDLAWACCNQIECKGAYHQCVDYGGKDICNGLDRSICDGIYTSVLRCSSSSPYCINYSRSSSLGDEEIATSLACGASGGEVLVLITPTNGKAEDGDSAPSTTGGNSPSQAADTTSEVDVFSPTTAASSSGSTSSPSPSKNDGGTKLSAGAITGIVIPVAAMIVGIIAAWWRPHQVLWLVTCCMCGSRHSKKRNPVDPSHATQPLMLHPYRQPPPVNHGPRYYPPQASVYAVNNPAPHIYPQGVWQNGNYR